jgi:hypothetical protein
VWGNITGTLTDQTDLNTALGLKANLTSPSFTTPNLGVASATTINKVTLTAPATGSTLTIADGKTLTASNTLTLTGTDASSIAFGTGGTVAYQNQVNTFTQNQILTLPTLTGSTATNGIDISQTWNTAGTPSAIKLNVINTTSNIASSLLDLQVGGTSRFRVLSNGQLGAGPSLSTFAPFIGGTIGAVIQGQSGGGASLIVTDNSKTAGLTFLATSTLFKIFGDYYSGTTEPTLSFGTFSNQTLLNLAHGATGGLITMTPATYTATTGTVNAFSHTASFSPTSGTAVWNQMTLAPTINQTGGASGITRGLYINPTLTAATDFRALEVATGKSVFSYASAASTPSLTTTGAWFTGGTSITTKPHVLIEASGATSTGWHGSGTGLGVNAASTFGGNLIDAQLNGSSIFKVSPSATFTATISGSLLIGSDVTINNSFLKWSGFSQMRSTVDGNLTLINNANNNFSLLQLGGTTSSFPALKRNSTAIDVRLADDSGFAGLNAGALAATGLIVGGTTVYGNRQMYGTGTTSSFDYFSDANGTGGMRLYGTAHATNPNGILFYSPANVSLQLGGTTSLFPALQTASSNAQTALTATFTNGSPNIITVANTFATNDVVQFTGTLPTGISAATNYFIVGTPTTTQTGLTATFTNGNANIVTTTNTYAAGDVVQFTSTGTLPTGFALLTNYYVIATGLTTTNIQVSATLGGAAITPSSAGSGVQTVTRQPAFTVSATTGGSAITPSSAGTSPWTVVRQTSATITNGTSTWTSTFAHGLRVGDVIRFTSTPPTNFATATDYYVLTVPSTTTFTLAATLGGTVISAGSAVTTAMVFSRSQGIYIRTADNSDFAELNTGRILTRGLKIDSGPSGNSLSFQIQSADNRITQPSGYFSINNGSGSQLWFNTDGSITNGQFTPSPVGKFNIRGTGTSSATISLRVEKSDATATLLIRDDGSTSIGQSSVAISTANAVANGRFAADGDAQTQNIRLRNAITGTAQSELFADGATIRAVLATNRAWSFDVQTVAICTLVGNGTCVLGDVYTINQQGIIKRIGATTSIVGTVSTVTNNNDTSMASAVVTTDADAANNALRVRFTPPSTAGSTSQFRVVTTLTFTEVAY